jgi:AcrR family transcriptional regulator
MARPVNANAKETRGRILDKALFLFSEAGVDGASIRQISAASQVSVAMVHHYFGSKEGLYEACIDAMYAELMELQGTLKPLLLRHDGSRDLLERLVREYSRFARAHSRSIRLLLRNVMDRGELDAQRREQYQIPVLKAGAQLLAPVLGRDPVDLQLHIQSTMHLVVRYAVTNPEELGRLSGVEGSENEILQHVEDHLVSVAFRIFDL